MRFGVCWYPEQWPAERWPVDVALQSSLGLELVRIGEFSWSTFEPRRGQFDWRVLDRAVELIDRAGMSVVMGTPTAAPPVWLVEERPEILSVGPDGRSRPIGSRRHTCTTSAAYRHEAMRVVGTMVDRYGSAVAAWQVDNELGNHDSARCWCDACQPEFARWLERRYGEIERLNRAWGTAFWSQTYPTWRSVALPRPTMTDHNPALLLAHRRFASAQSVGFASVQFDLIRERLGSATPITSNLYCEDLAVDVGALAGLGDLASVDSYPHGVSTPFDTAFLLDLHRGAASKAWVMEQQAGPVNWTEFHRPVEDGRVRTWMWQAALHGFEALLFFRWRAGRFGQEQYHSGLLDHAGKPSRRLPEIEATIADIRAAGDLSPAPKVALLHSIEDAWLIGINPQARGLTHRRLLSEAYSALRTIGLEVAVVDPLADLGRYDLIVAPALHMATLERVRALSSALERGATVILGPRSLCVDEDGAWFEGAVPHVFAGRLGAELQESLGQVEQVTVDPWGTPAGIWTDTYTEAGDVLARYRGSPIDGRPAAIRTDNLIQVGFSDRASWAALFSDLTGRPASMDMVERFQRGEHRYTIDHERITVDRASVLTE